LEEEIGKTAGLKAQIERREQNRTDLSNQEAQARAKIETEQVKADGIKNLIKTLKNE